MILTLILGLLATVQSRSIPINHGNAGLIARASRSGYAPTFYDEFLGSVGSLPSSSNWDFDIGTQSTSDHEEEIYTNDTANIHITPANTLAITPLHNNGTWTSARIKTQRADFVAQPGGKLFVEARIKLGDAPQSEYQSFWPAFWAIGSGLGEDDNQSGPQDSEWDFLEAISGLPTKYSAVHCGIEGGRPCKELFGLGNGDYEGVPNMHGEWHTVGFEVDRSDTESWKDEMFRWFLDGILVSWLMGDTVGDEAAWRALAHDPHFLLLNVAVGGDSPQAPNNKTIDGPGVGMEVDYVGVWNSV